MSMMLVIVRPFTIIDETPLRALIGVGLAAINGLMALGALGFFGGAT